MVSLLLQLSVSENKQKRGQYFVSVGTQTSCYDCIVKLVQDNFILSLLDQLYGMDLGV